MSIWYPREQKKFDLRWIVLFSPNHKFHHSNLTTVYWNSDNFKCNDFDLLKPLSDSNYDFISVHKTKTRALGKSW